MKAATPGFMFWLPWILMLLLVLWFAISLILAEQGYDSLRWS